MKALLPATLLATLLAACTSMPGAVQRSQPAFGADGVMVGANQMTLYTYAKDTKGSGQSECYQQCAINWPPALAEGTDGPSGDFAVIIRTDGKRQWAYQGLPLYYFNQDAKAGDRNGDGRGGNWKVIRR